MKKLLTLGKLNQVVGISSHNAKTISINEGDIDITDIEIPADVNVNPQNWTFEEGSFRKFSDEEKNANDFPDETYWSRMRLDREKLLIESDWTQVPDSPVDSAAWATYRQQLRDLPANTSNPRNISWPTKPT